MNTIIEDFSKTIVCFPLQFDFEYERWLTNATKKYRASLNPSNIYCHINWFNLTIIDIKHEGIYHYIRYTYNDGGTANMPDDDHE